MIMNTMKSLNVKNMMYVAAFMAVTSMVQAAQTEAAVSSDTPKEKKSIFERAQGRVNSLADRARTKMGIGEEKAEKKVTQGEENLNKRIGRVSEAVSAVKSKATETAACVKKEVYTAQLAILQTQTEKAQEMSSFFAAQKEQLDKQIKDTLNKIATANKVCAATGESAGSEEKSE